MTVIGDGAFLGCRSLTSITIPHRVTSIGSYAFADCNSLENIYVADENVNFCSKEGVLFSKDKSLLMCYPKGKSNTNYIILNGVMYIDTLAFVDCSSLTRITIPDSVTSIGTSAFYGCGSLADVYYSGTVAGWNAIEIEGDNKSLTNATIHYNYIITEIYNHNVSSNGNSYTYSYNIKLYEDTTGKIIIALYDGNCLVGLQIESITTVDGGYVALNKPVTTTSTPSTYKIFFWNNLSDLVPLCEIAEGEITN